MKLQMENWAEQNLCQNGIELFKESAICYKTGAYRSAFLMSYLAFKTTIRERVLTAKKPDDIRDEEWEKGILQPLKNDDQWEGKINQLVDCGKVFKFSNGERMKNRYVYWKNTRNSCAHAKKEQITSATVEHFWNYIKDDLAEYYVLGGRSYLLDELCRDYQYFYSVGEDTVKQTLEEIACVYQSDTHICFDEMIKRMPQCMPITNGNFEFWKVIVECNNNYISEGFIDFLNQKGIYFVGVYQKFPLILNKIAAKHIDFIQREVAPLLEGKSYFENEENVFWSLLYQVLNIGNKLIDIDRITSRKRNLIWTSNVQNIPEHLSTFQKYKIFNKLLCNAGKQFFSNTSGAQWEYYGPGGEITDENVRDCFKYIEWTIDIVSMLEQSYQELIASLEIRVNPDSINNGHKRKTIYQEIIEKYKHEIVREISRTGKDISEFPNIEAIISNKNNN